MRPDLDQLGLIATRSAPLLAESYYVDERVRISLPDGSEHIRVVTKRTPLATGLRLELAPAEPHEIDRTLLQ